MKIKTNLRRFIAATSITALTLAGIPSVNAIDTVTATPSTHTFSVDGEVKPMAAYVINGNNYLKLRDIAAVVNGTPKQFEVGWDASKNAINLTANQPYTAVGGELGKISAGAVAAKSSTAKVYKDSTLTNYTGYNIAGNNYYKLRDVADSFDIGIEWDAATTTSNIVTKQADAAPDEKPAENTMKEVSNNPGYFYTSLIEVGEDEQGSKLRDPEKRLRNWELYMVDCINAERRKVGLNELVIDEDTMGFSRYWAEHLTTDFRHADIDDAREYAATTDLSEKEARHKILKTGENIGRAGISSIPVNPIKALMNALMNSPGHKAAILDSDAKTVGVGLAADDSGALCCCQNFGMVLYKN